MPKREFYDLKKKDLNDADILEGLKEAIEDYNNGAILECRDTLFRIVRAISEYERGYPMKARHRSIKRGV